MKKKISFIMSIALVFVLCFSLMPVSAHEGGAAKDGITVHFILLGDGSHDSDTDGKVHTYLGRNLSKWIDTEVQAEEGSKALDVFEKALENSGLEYINQGGSYISEINGLSGGGNGEKSGWLLMINGEYAFYGINEQPVYDGDVMVFHYTDNYMIDMGYEPFDTPFTDIGGHWAYDSIVYAFKNNIFNGMSDVCFEPEGIVNRAMVTAVLYRMENEPDVEETDIFSDVPSGQWFTDSVAWAYDKKIVKGMGDGKFAPENSIKREVLVTMLMRYADYKGMDTGRAADITVFNDCGQISSWAVSPVKRAYAECLINGRTEYSFEPGGSAKRAELAVILYRFSRSVEERVIEDTASYLLKSVPEPGVSSAGGEWTVLGLARSGAAVEDAYFEKYITALEEKLRSCNGELSTRRYSEYSRVIIALSALGKDARSIAGFDLTMPLGDYENTIRQGLNGAIWALIALDCLELPMPCNEAASVQASRQMYVDYILSKQLPEGGWSVDSEIADPDITGMAMQALSKYMSQPEVEAAVELALKKMSETQLPDGGFSGQDGESSESCAQMIVALCELGIPIDDRRFVKNGNTAEDCLMSYFVPHNGFKHIKQGSGGDLMASEQAFYSLVALKRIRNGESSLYRMNDVKKEL